MNKRKAELHDDSMEVNMPVRIFKYESEEEHLFSEVRTIETSEGKILFCASDVAKMLGYSNPHDAISKHCRSLVKCEVPHPQNTQKNIELGFIPEGDVYRLIVRSKLESAERFESWLFDEVVPSIREKGYYGKIDRSILPNFMLRYKENLYKIERGYFSVISELFVTLGTELSKYGYDIPDKGVDGKGLYPDISVGKTFANYLKKIEHPDREKYKHYRHSFIDDRFDCDARMYHLDLLPAFRNFVFEIWVPKYAHDYFKTRDPKALGYLPKLIGK